MGKLLQPTEHEVEKITEEQYDEMLDEQGDVHIGSLTFSPSEIIKKLDPIAYRCGFNDIQEYETHYHCPICDTDHETDEDAALYCCQSEEE